MDSLDGPSTSRRPSKHSSRRRRRIRRAAGRPIRRSSRRSTAESRPHRRGSVSGPDLDLRHAGRLAENARAARRLRVRDPPGADLAVVGERPERRSHLHGRPRRIRRPRTCGRPTPATTSVIGRRTSLSFARSASKASAATILGRNGVVMSDRLETTTRIRQIAPDRLLVIVVLTDSEALTRPWPVAFTYTRLPRGQHRVRLRVRREQPQPRHERRAHVDARPERRSHRQVGVVHTGTGQTRASATTCSCRTSRAGGARRVLRLPAYGQEKSIGLTTVL